MSAHLVPGAVAEAISNLLLSMAEEVRAYRGVHDDTADRATSRAYRAGLALIDLPLDEGLQHPDYIAALALFQRRWLVMSGAYEEEGGRDVCRLVDATLAGHRFDEVPLLWHLNGEPRAERPTAAEFAAAMEAASC